MGGVVCFALENFSQIMSMQDAEASEMPQGLTPSSVLRWMLTSYAHCN